MSRKRRNHSPEFKAKVAVAAVKGDETLSELSKRFGLNANLIVKWKKQLLENSAEVFASGKGLAPDRETEIKDLQAKIGEITMVNDAEGAIQSARSLTKPERKKMINRKHKLSLVKQCETLDIPRSGVYYEPKPESGANMCLMRLIDEIHLERPFLGVRRVTDELHDRGYLVNHKRVWRLMGKMGIEAIYPKPNLSKANPKHKIYPYLLRGLKIRESNQVWASDITYIPMNKGFTYLTVIMDWFSRRILAWRLSNSLDSSFCVDALEEAIYRHGKPEIFNTDQGSQYTSEAFTNMLIENNIRISMDGKGAWRDNVFVERLWRSVKYEEVYLNAYESMNEAKTRIGNWIDFYNKRRKHQTLKTTPNEKYGIVSKLKLAA